MNSKWIAFVFLVQTLFGSFSERSRRAEFAGAIVPFKVILFQMDLKENLSVTIIMKARWIDLCSGEMCMYIMY